VRSGRSSSSICNEILTREPAHVDALNLLGLILQASARHKLAVKTLNRAIAADASNAACHYDLACSLQALGRDDEAAVHFSHAITLGAALKPAEDLILRNPAIAACVERIEAKWPLPVRPDELLAGDSLQSIACDLYLRCALSTVPLQRAPLEKLLSHLRAVLLHSAVNDVTARDGAMVRLLCAVARQCFINEYVFTQSDEETRQSAGLREGLLQKLRDGDAIAPMLLAAVAAYFPLHSLPLAGLLLERQLPDIAADIVRPAGSRAAGGSRGTQIHSCLDRRRRRRAAGDAAIRGKSLSALDH
jgi:tetratricopeptide (TPR) repeat protein